MKMKKKIIVILIMTMLMPFTEVLAIEMPVLNNSNTQGSLAREVCIDGLYDNSILYVGANTKILGYIDNDKSKKEVEWQVTGNKGIIDLNSNGGEASIIAKNQGTVWIMAKATDGSYAAREYAVNVKYYPSDESSQSLIGTNIIPILKRPFDGNSSILRVEVKSDLSLNDKKSAMESYIRKLLKAGDLTNRSAYEDDYYKYFIISTNSQNIEVRIQKTDTSYDVLSQIISDVSKYKGTNIPPENVVDTNKDIVDENKTAEKTEETNGAIIPSENTPNNNNNKVDETEATETAQGTNGANILLDRIEDTNNKLLNKDKFNRQLANNFSAALPSRSDGENLEKKRSTSIFKRKEIWDTDGITIVGGTGTTVEDPLILTVNEKMSLDEKLKCLNEYMKMLRNTRSVQFIKKVDNKEYISYIFKVSSKLENTINHILMGSKNSKVISKNDFFIEFRVNKNDKEAFIPIIEMLDNEMYSSNKVASEKNGNSEENLSNVENDGRYKNYMQMTIIGFILILGVGILFKRLNRR